MKTNGIEAGVPRPEAQQITGEELRRGLTLLLLGRQHNLPPNIMAMVNEIQLARALSIPPWELAAAAREHREYVILADAFLAAEQDARTLASRVIRP